MFLAAKIAYDGSKFFGFAKQEKIYISVMQRLQEVLQSLGITSQIVAAGRTDRGVHATGQIICFKAPKFWEIERLRSILNQKFYPNIFVRRLWRVSKDFHPRFHAKKREYRYIFGNFSGNIWLTPYISREFYGSEEKISEALKLFIGKRDFKFFSKTGSDNKTTLREIYKVRFYKHTILNQKYYVICFQANGFLYGQIRLMIGAIFAYSIGKISKEELIQQILGIKRAYAIPVSPNGLYLTKIFY